MRLEDRTPALAELTEAQREQAMARFRVLRSHTERDVPLPGAAEAAGVVCELSSDGSPNIALKA